MLRSFWLALVFVTIAGAQVTEFEAVSIKPSQPGDTRRPSMEFLPGGRFRSLHMPLLPVLATAYNVPFSTPESLRIQGVPNWIFTEPYDIEATSKAPDQPVRPMLRATLADRLKLVMRSETRETAVYAVMIGQHGLKLERSEIDEKDCTESGPFGPLSATAGCHQVLGGAGHGMRARAANIADLALCASGWSDAPVVDRTGLTGLYAFQTEGWSTAPDDDRSRPALSEIFERLGLKLVRKKAPVEMFTIEHVERPSAN
jgi:uncharacterized protein (TIGR03435 family)